MADQQPHTAGDRPVQPGLHNRRRQQAGSSGHPIYRRRARPPGTADQWTAALAEGVDGLAVTHHVDRSFGSSCRISDRHMSEQLEAAEPRQDYPTCLLCCEIFKVLPLLSTRFSLPSVTFSY